MADPTISAIDRFFDTIDKGVEAADRVLYRSKSAMERVQGAVPREVIDATPVEESAPKKASRAPAKSTALAKKKPHFYIVEAFDARGNTLYVVTDGGNARTECPSREFATQILRALEKAP